jgi:hypothetical protein
LCREYLNLQKWIEDKIREHKEIFVLACVKFLQVSQWVPPLEAPLSMLL